MNTDGTGFNTCKECHKTEYVWNHTTTDHKEGEQLEDRRSVGASSCNSGDGTDQRAQTLIFMIMVIFNFFYLDNDIGWNVCIIIDIRLCSWMYVLCSTLCRYYVFLFIIF